VKQSDLRVSLLGCGRVGGSLAMATPGARIWGRNPERARAVAASAGVQAVTDLDDALDADLILLTVPERSIPELVEKIVLTGMGKGQVAAHTAAVLGLEHLNPLADQGFRIGKCHPMFPFASPATPLPARVIFGIEGDESSAEILQSFVEMILGIPLPIHASNRVAYHLMGIFASNFLMGLLKAAESLAAGLDTKVAPAEILLPLVEGTVKNYHEMGVEKGLTGPWTRGDEETLRLHLQALHDRPDLQVIYTAMARYLLPETSPLRYIFETNPPYKES